MLTVNVALRYLVWFGLITMLALAHVYLRFSIRDLLMETRHLQQEKAELENKKTLLVSDTEYLKNDERMCAYATEKLNLVHSKPNQIEHLVVSNDLVDKYRNSSSAYRHIKFWKEEEPSAGEKIMKSLSRFAESSVAGENVAF